MHLAYKFTGKERDTESGLDYFGARYYGSSMGRFMSPDPLGGHMENPQSLNKYAYALNNPGYGNDSVQNGPFGFQRAEAVCFRV